MPPKLFTKGNSGRPKGALNKVSRSVKSVVIKVFNDLQTDPKHNLEAFAKKYPKEFYLIASKLIPSEVLNDNTGQITHRLIIEDATGCDPIADIEIK